MVMGNWLVVCYKGSGKIERLSIEAETANEAKAWAEAYGYTVVKVEVG